jgi:AcrR family transcriptional regulator
MARPVNADPKVTREKLLDEAIIRFARHGFRGASAREVAQAASVNPAVVAYYFQGKQGLYDACVDEVYRRLSKRVNSAFADLVPQEIPEIIDRVYRAAREEREGIRLLVRQIVDHGHLTGRTESMHFLPNIETITTIAVQRTGCTREQARAAAVTLGYAVSRFVIQDDNSLKTAFGARTVEQAHKRAIQILSTTAQALLGMRN